MITACHQVKFDDFFFACSDRTTVMKPAQHMSPGNNAQLK